ncbi:MAG: glycoside hydrolase family 127 protein, partial [Verrucomicrobia bacterium]|nr:glycoside hydrolase family 127 protein [Verrucomicrobiota bacterium]
MNGSACRRAVGAALLSLAFLQTPLQAASPAPRVKIKDTFSRIPIRNVALGGEIGRRVDITIANNIKALDLEKNFIIHFVRKNGPNVAGGFIGMGMLIDACARLAAYSGDPELAAIKDRLVRAVIEHQLPNGYSGFYRQDRRLWNPPGSRGDNWDIHEMAFLIEGLLTDYELFGNRRSLHAARETADFI